MLVEGPIGVEIPTLVLISGNNLDSSLHNLNLISDTSLLSCHAGILSMMNFFILGFDTKFLAPKGIISIYMPMLKWILNQLGIETMSTMSLSKEIEARNHISMIYNAPNSDVSDLEIITTALERGFQILPVLQLTSHSNISISTSASASTYSEHSEQTQQNNISNISNTWCGLPERGSTGVVMVVGSAIQCPHMIDGASDEMIWEYNEMYRREVSRLRARYGDVVKRGPDDEEDKKSK